MSKGKIRFSLKLKENAEAHSLQELRENFDLKKIIQYFSDKTLERWLDAWMLTDEAEKVRALNKGDKDIGRKLCEIFGVEPQEEAVDAENIVWRTERLEQLKQHTGDPNILKNIDRVAFNETELKHLLSQKGNDTIYLCSPKIKLSKTMLKREGMHYIGLGKVEAVIESKKVIDFDALRIKFENVQFDEAYIQLLEKRKEGAKTKRVAKKITEYKCATDEIIEKSIDTPKEDGVKQFIAKIGGLALLSEKVKTSGKLKFKFMNNIVYGTIIYERDMGIHAEPAQRIEIGVELSQPTPLKVRTQFEIINIHTKITEGKITRLCSPFSVLDKENQKIFEQGLKYEAFNIPEAKKYYEIAAKAGYVEAIRRLIFLYEHANYQTGEAQKMAKYWTDKLNNRL